MLSFSDIVQFKRDHPNWDKTIVKVYDDNDKLLSICAFKSNSDADKYILSLPADVFVVVDYQ